MDCFWDQVAKGGSDHLWECWPWQGSRNKGGYGQLRWDGRTQLAHRVAYALAIGTIPDGLYVLHLCDNPSCCNPAHLRAGTHEENVADAVAKGRARYGEQKGERHGGARLTDAQVQWVRDRVREGRMTRRAIAAQVGVTAGYISDLARGRYRRAE